MKSKYEYNLNSYTVFGSFDYGEVIAENHQEAIDLAIDEITTDIKRMNELFNGEYSIDVDFGSLEVKEVFDFRMAMDEWGMNFGDDCNNLQFNYDKSDGKMYLRYPQSVVERMKPLFGEIYFQVSILNKEKKGLQIELYDNDRCEDDYVVTLTKLPSNSKEFNEFINYLIGQLCTVECKFANVDMCVLDKEKQEYTVEGFLIPQQTISFVTYSDWDCIHGVMGQPVFDCQIDMELYTEPDSNGGKSEFYNFQYVDLNYDAEEGVFNLDDTMRPFGGSTSRLYRGTSVMFTESEVEHCGLYSVQEVRSFRVDGIMYEVHIDSTNARVITNVYAEKGEVTDGIMKALEKAVEKIEI